MKDSLGIIGGVGSKASAYFYDMIIDNTLVNNDQEHLNMIIFNHAGIPDRTSYILDNNKECPLDYLIEDAKKLESLGCKMIAIPCNTSCYFHKEVQESVNIPVLSLVDDTVKYLNDNNIKEVYVLATTGTINTRLYQDACDKYNINYEVPNTDIQSKVMSVIYDYVKNGKNVDISLWNEIVRDAKDKYVMLGCTELSILKKAFKLGDKFIDPLYIETTIILDYFNKKIR